MEKPGATNKLASVTESCFRLNPLMKWKERQVLGFWPQMLTLRDIYGSRVFKKQKKLFCKNDVGLNASRKSLSSKLGTLAVSLQQIRTVQTGTPATASERNNNKVNVSRRRRASALRVRAASGARG